MDSPFVLECIERVRKVKQDLPEAFAPLSDAQFNWKPDAKSWSVGQCVDHIITTNEVYFKALDEVANGPGRRNFWSRIPFWPALCGSLMLSLIQPEPKRKAKTVPVFEPSQSAIPKSRLQDFQTNCDAFTAYLEQFKTANLTRTIVISPASELFTFKLKDVLLILTNHMERHFAQARNVMLSEGFVG